MTNQVRIVSYFGVPVDLAYEMRDWEEFVSGEGYTVNLKSIKTDEIVSVSYIVTEEGEWDYVLVKSNASGELLDRVIGKAIRALIMHSDNLMIYR
jgi:hypothetical protein